jgi:hypothetical protein
MCSSVTEQTEKVIACEHEKELCEMSPRSRASQRKHSLRQKQPYHENGVAGSARVVSSRPCRSIKIASNLCGARKTLLRDMKNSERFSHFALGRGSTP